VVSIGRHNITPPVYILSACPYLVLWQERMIRSAVVDKCRIASWENPIACNCASIASRVTVSLNNPIMVFSLDASQEHTITIPFSLSSQGTGVSYCAPLAYRNYLHTQSFKTLASLSNHRGAFHPTKILLPCQ
jgi:hypothetical protein